MCKETVEAWLEVQSEIRLEGLYNRYPGRNSNPYTLECKSEALPLEQLFVFCMRIGNGLCMRIGNGPLSTAVKNIFPNTKYAT
jgi:hypothetical protein